MTLSERRRLLAGVAVAMIASTTFWILPTSASASGWTPSEAPAPSDAVASFDMSLSAISCPSVTSCTAVGGYTDLDSSQQGLIERMAKGKWTSLEAPVPQNGASKPALSLSSVACPSINFCVAVGDYADNAGGTDAVLESLVNGVWSGIEAPMPSNAGPLGGGFLSVDCVSAVMCVAVGDYADMSGNDQGLIDSWNGTTWSAAEAPMPPDSSGSSADLSAVACGTPRSCVATGGYNDTSGNIEGVIDTEAHNAWSAVSTPLPGDASGDPFVELNGISCTATICAAAGDYETDNGQQGLLERDSNGAWSATEAPLPGDAQTGFQFADLRSIDCQGPKTCIAIGIYYGPSGTENVIDSLGVSGWIDTQASAPSNNSGTNSELGGLSSVTCTTATRCTAVGTYSGPNGTTQAAAATLTQGTWNSIELPPADQDQTDGVSFVGPVSCASSDHCAVLLSHQSDSDGLVDVLSKGTWNTTPRVLPPDIQGFESSLNSVSCATAGACVVAGQFGNVMGETRPEIDSSSNSSWSSIDAALPTGDPRLSLGSFGQASCGSPMLCSILGTYGVGDTGLPFVDSLSGETWSSEVTPTPGDAREADVSDTSCGPEVCDIVGGYYDLGFGVGRAFINGGDVELPSNSTMFSSSYASSVSCASDGSCTIVGGYTDTSDTHQGFIISSSTSQEAPTPVQAATDPDMSLSAVQCASVSSCIAVGSYENAAGNTEGLIETLAGSEWSATKAPIPADASLGDPHVSFSAITCGETGSCAAMGKYTDSGNNVHVFVDSLSSKGKWSASVPSVPANASSGGSGPTFASIACAGGGICYLVGMYDVSGTTNGFIDTLAAGVWSASEAPLPTNASGTPNASLDSISCPTSGGCVAVGHFADTSGITHGLIESAG